MLCKEYSLIKYEKEIIGKHLKQFTEMLKEIAKIKLKQFGMQVVDIEDIENALKEIAKV